MSDPSRITIYGSATCSYCLAAKMLLKKKGLAFTDIPIGSDPEVRQEIARRGGGRSIPQIFIDDNPIGGFDALQALEKSGELDRLLGAGDSVTTKAN